MKLVQSGNLLVAAAALLWGTSFVAVRWGLENEMNPLFFVSLRFLIAALLFLPIAMLKVAGIKRLLLSPSIILLGFINAIGFAFQFIGQKFTTAGNASLFVNFYVILVPLLAPLLLPERYSWRIDA